MLAQRALTVLFALIALALVTGCQPATEEAAPEAAAGPRIENPELGVAIAELPADFVVVSNDGDTIELAPAGEDAAGEVEIFASEPESGGINLVAAVEQHQAELEARPAAEYKGQRELGSQLGTAFYSRGRYQDEDGAMAEEIAVFLIHPRGDRKLQLLYRYPAGDTEDSRRRLETLLFGLLSELEALDVQ